MKKIYPIYNNKKSPCYSVDHLDNYGCPARTDIARFMFSIGQKQYSEAFEIIKKTNPFSGGCGRFCDHPCEKACNRAKFDEPVDIKYLERFASDYGFQKNLLGNPPKQRKHASVAIIGSGPAGLSTAYFLAREGYDACVYEKSPEPGGILVQGIPIFRYPKEVREYEIRYIQSYGVEIKTNYKIHAKDLQQLIKDYDAVVVATGAQKPRQMEIEGDNLEGIHVGFEFLKQLHFSPDFLSRNYEKILKKMKIGKTVAVIGGGYTAFDVARSLVRLGSNPSVYYRRGVEQMTAHPGELREAEREGIQFHFMIAPKKVEKQDNGRLKMTLNKMWLGEKDNTGRGRPIPVPGSEHSIEVDNIITAIGETPELGFIPGDYAIEGFQLLLKGLDKELQKKVFITGDALQGSMTATGMVVRAVGLAQDTTLEVRRFLGESIDDPNYYENVATYDTIQKRYFGKEARVRIDKLAYKDRKNNFEEVDQPLSEELAVAKAKRCWNCGVCIQCDWCRDYSNQAIVKLSKSWDPGKTSHFYKFVKEKVDWSTRESVTGCPRNAMAMVPYEKDWKKIVDEQYISFDDIKY